MKTLVVYYSKSGNTKAVAEAIAAAAGADTERIVEIGVKRDGFLGFLRSGRDGMRKRPSAIEAPKARGADYDCVIVGTPVWGWNLVPAIRSYLSSAKLAGTRVAFFCTMGSSGYEKTFASMRQLAHGAELLGDLAIAQEELKDRSVLHNRIAAWLDSIGVAANEHHRAE